MKTGINLKRLLALSLGASLFVALPAGLAFQALAEEVIAARSGMVYRSNGIDFMLETPGRVHSVSFPTDKQVRFELRPGERRLGDKGARERVEFRYPGTDPNGALRCVTGRFLVEDNPIDAQFFKIMQWVDKAAGRNGYSPWFSVGFDSKAQNWRIYLGQDSKPEEPALFLYGASLPIEPAEWNDFKVVARTGKDDGFVQFYLNGTEVISYRGALGYFNAAQERGRVLPSSMGYFKFGIYRWGDTFTLDDQKRPRPTTHSAVVWFEDIRLWSRNQECLE